MKRIPWHNIDPTPFVGVIVLEHGQTVSTWLDVHGMTVDQIPEDTVIVELSS